MKRVFAIGMVAWGTMASQISLATILPPNDLHLEDSLEKDSNITEAKFNALIDQAAKFYAPIVAKNGGKLVFKRLWKDSTVNAGAIQIGKTWEVHMYGGLARREEITPDGFTMVICHELGHHLAGFPYVSDWAANEGQADYFAALSCARELWKNDGIKNAQARDAAPAFVKNRCDDIWQTESAQNLCYRTMLAGRSLAELLADGERIAFNTPDAKKVRKTFDEHPEAQCRLDTFVAGSACIAEFDRFVIPGDEEESSRYTCTEAAQYSAGLRPTCWFKPGL